MLHEKGIGITKPILIKMNLAPNEAASARARINIRKLNANDLKNVLNLFAKHMNIGQERISTFRRRSVLSYVLSVPFGLLGEDTFIGLIAETDDGHIVGAIFARRFPFGKSWVIGPVIVHPNFRGSSIATCIMNFTVEHLRKRKAKWAILSVETSNIQGRSFFEKSEFEYMGPVFADHEQARKYVQMFTLISGYLQNTTCKIEQYPLQTKIAFQGDSDQKPRTNGTRTWRIMLREL